MQTVQDVELGTSRLAAAKQFGVTINVAMNLVQHWKQRGIIKADKYGCWKRSELGPNADRIRALVAETCDITIEERCDLLATEGSARAYWEPGLYEDSTANGRVPMRFSILGPLGIALSKSTTEYPTSFTNILHHGRFSIGATVRA